MFCSKCGNPLQDDAKFCGACGAPVKISQEASPAPQQPAGIPDETVNIQAPKREPVMGAQNFSVQMNGGDVTSVQKKSKKGLIIGLSLGGVLLAVILAVALIFVFGLKGGSKGNDGSVPLGYSTVVYDDQYTYFLSVTETWEPCIKRVQNDLRGKPELLYESKEIKGNGWSRYTLGNIFLWSDKICFMEITKATEQGDREYEIHWLSKDGKENGTLVSYEQLNAYGELLSQTQGIFFFDDYLIFSNSYFFYRLDLNTGELCKQEDFLDLEGSAYFVAYNDGYYYYLVPDIENNLMGETLYRKAVDSEEEIVGKVPSQDDDDIQDFLERYFPFIPKDDYLYYADSDNICRLNIEDGNTETLASYDDDVYNRFCLSENGLYYFKNMTLCFLNTETLEETVFDKVERVPKLIYAGANDACWMQGDSTSQRYNCFLPDKQGGSLIYFGESGQDASIDNQEIVNTTELYADVVNQAIAEHGDLGFRKTYNECTAVGVIKVNLLDFNRDGTEELVMLYNGEENGAHPVVEVWTVKGGETVQVFSEKTRDEFHEEAMIFSLYENAGNLYVPVYDSLDHDPVYVHLYGFDGSGEFTELYQYENNAFYMNQLPDGMKFTKYDETRFYTNYQFAYDEGFENAVKSMEETLRADMEYMLNVLGIAVPENSSEDLDGPDSVIDWCGVYQYDDGNQGELIIINESNGSEVRGVYVFAKASGAYDQRDFVWSKDGSVTASEPFQNGIDSIFYHLENDRIVVDYPDGWWADREYVWVSDIEHMDENVHHPFFTKQADSPTTGFYGVWVAASKDYNEAKRYVDSLVQDGFESDVYETTDWSNLNTEHWYVVSVGAYSTEEEAYEILSRVKNAGYANAYVKYTGDKLK